MDPQNTPPADGAPTPKATDDTPPTDDSKQDSGTPPTTGTGSDNAQGGDERDESALPEWARTELAGARKDADRYRAAAKELRESLSQAKSPQEFEAASARVAELESALHRERLARTYQLPEALAARIAGDTEEEREADAKALAEVFQSRTVPLGRGGLDPSETTTPTDPAKLAGLIPRGRH